MRESRGETAVAQVVRSVLVAQRAHLLAVVRRRAGSKVDADEILQVALERALGKSAQLRDVAHAEAWIGRVVQNTLIDELRKHRHQVPLDGHERSDAGEERATCWCALAQLEQLKPEYARVLRGVIVEGHSVAQVAKELGVTMNNATVRLHRARRALKARLAAHCGTTTARECADCGCEERGCCPHP